MSLTITHTTVAVGTDAGNGEIHKNDWNANHSILMATNKLLGRSTAGAGTVEEISIGSTLALNAGTLGVGTGVPITAVSMNTAKILGRTTASSGAVEEISAGSGLSLSSGSLAVSNVPISSITMNTAKILGRTTASSGAAEEIAVGTNLTLSAGTLALGDIVTNLDLVKIARDGNGNISGILDHNNVPVTSINKTLAQWLALTSTQVADGAVIHITDVHGTSGAGGVYATWDATASKWGQNFGSPWVFSTLSLATTNLPPATFVGWKVKITGIPGTLISNGTKYVPDSGRIALVGLMYGTPASPTKNSGAVAAPYSFNIGSPTFPAALFGAGAARLYLKARFQRHNGGTPANLTVAIRLGTDTTTPTNNRPIWSNTLVNANLLQNPAEVYIEFPDATHFVTNASNGQAGGGSTGNLTTETTNVNTAAAMILSVDIIAKDAGDTLDLLSLSLEWGEI